MSNYAKVEFGQVVSIGALPRNYMNVSGFNFLSNEALKEYGFYPLTIVTPEFDHLTEKLGALSYEVEADAVVGTYAVEALSSEEMEAEKDSFVNAARTKLNTVLYETDWIYLADSGLTEPQEAAYVALRADAIAVRTDLETYDVQELSGLISALDAAADCTCSRMPDFTEPMTDLAAYLASLLAE
jgi:hypothetical protein